METKDLIYLWRVIDAEGKILDQLNETGQGRKLEEIEVLKRPYTIYLIPQRPGLPQVSVKISGTKRFIYFRKIHKKVSMLGSLFKGEQTVSTVYALGWQDTVEGKNVKSIMWISENGDITEDTE